MKFIKPVEAFIGDYCEGLGLSRYEFLENILVDFMARLAVKEELLPGAPKPLPMFVETDGKLLCGEKLFEHLIYWYSNELGADGQEREDPGKVQEIIKREQERRVEMQRIKKIRSRLVADGICSTEEAEHLGMAIEEPYKRYVAGDSTWTSEAMRRLVEAMIKTRKMNRRK